MANQFLKFQQDFVRQDSVAHPSIFIYPNPINHNELKLYWGDFKPNYFLQTQTEIIGPPLPFTVKPETLTGGLFFIYISILLVWAFLFRTNLKGLGTTTQSFWSNHTFFQELKDKSGNNRMITLGMLLSALLVISIFTYQLSHNFNLTLILTEIQQPLVIISLIAIALVCILFCKILIVVLSALIFSAPQSLSGFILLHINTIQILGIILFPITVLVSYGVNIDDYWILNFGLLTVLIIFIYRMIRTFILGVKETNSQVFHIILYICAVEILPIMACYRLFTLW